MSLKTSVHRTARARWSRKSHKNMEVLSVKAIGSPLADFRHVSHIGIDADGDSFGDLSFLEGAHNLLMQTSQSEQNLFQACIPPPKPPRLNLDRTEATTLTRTNVTSESCSEKRKKCNSLPLLDCDEGEEETEGQQEMVIRPSSGWGPGTDVDSTQTSPADTLQSYEEDNSFSFSLDLGPSILDDVLKVMDRLHC
ncbi:hypothetical protein DPEC_G00315780 [Dallia pectoralis]|uniref:Uncharacterized protein n=1 Tax=Dallia pectoralis TaxID=75939 RepID=A0ACC2FCR9_DALPE|nr:hypothetical protein DPEC_G00315780 [Dallia pectoralis]